MDESDGSLTVSEAWIVQSIIGVGSTVPTSSSVPTISGRLSVGASVAALGSSVHTAALPDRSLVHVVSAATSRDRTRLSPAQNTSIDANRNVSLGRFATSVSSDCLNVWRWN